MVPYPHDHKEKHPKKQGHFQYELPFLHDDNDWVVQIKQISPVLQLSTNWAL